MREPTVPKLQKWPFLLGDLLLLGAAYWVQTQSQRPLDVGHVGLIVFCVSLGAVLAGLPFLLEYRAAVKLAEAEAIEETVTQIRKLEELAGQITGATGLWQTAQDAADKTAASAQAIAERMASEAKSFMEFLDRSNAGEKTALRLELEKFRRAQGEWMQVLVRLLDHVFALHQGALKSGQPKLVEQLTRFQHACYDAARRVGLAPFTAAPSEPFNAERHQPLEGNGQPPPNSVVEETVATGYSYQGKIARPALVRLRQNSGEVTASTAESVDPQGRLPMEEKQDEPPPPEGAA